MPKRICIGYCYVCDEPIYEDEAHYEMPDDEMVCEDCLDDWAKKYLRLGVEDLLE